MSLPHVIANRQGREGADIDKTAYINPPAESRVAASAIPDAGAIIRALEPLRLRMPGVLSGLTGGLELDLIVDTSLSMTMWQQTVTSFQTLLTGLGAFAEIRVISLDTDDPDASLVPLLESASRRLTVVLSDCVGRAWSAGNIQRSLEALAEMAPLTIVQMLPQRLWTSCGVDFVPVEVGARRCEGGAVRLWLVGPGNRTWWAKMPRSLCWN